MSEKFETKYNHLETNKKKREKFLKPLISDEAQEKNKTDAFFSIVKNSKRNEKKEVNEKNYYVSPMRGKIVNRATFPVTSSRGKIGKQYDFIRQDNKKKSNNYFDYPEFKILRQEEISQPVVKEKEPIVNTSFRSNPTKDMHSYEWRSEPEQLEEHEIYSPHPRQEEPRRPVFSEPLYPSQREEPVHQTRQSFNILYEEEIELNDERHIITSFDENQKNYYFGDYEKNYLHHHMNQPPPRSQTHVNVSKYNERTKVIEEIKELFSDVEEEPVRRMPVQYERTYEFGEERVSERSSQKLDQGKSNYSFNDADADRKVKKVEHQVKNDHKFKDLKRELDEALLKTEDKEDVVEERSSDDYTEYQFPPISLLNDSSSFTLDLSEWVNDQIKRLDQTFIDFGVGAKIVNSTTGPSVTRLEVEPDPGTKVSRITGLSDDIKLRLAANDIFMEAPIAGKSTVGIEVPNPETRMVNIREIIDSQKYRNANSPLKVALGLDITGEPIFSDIATMTHCLIAGSTGSGKSVCINGLIISILYNALPNEVKLVLIDPKKVEFSNYRDIPHLLTPVINDPKEATATLRWLTEEMDRRYELIESVGARDIKSYNRKRNRSIQEIPRLPYIVVIIDELADLMMVSANEVEEYIQRIAQLARAAGIHLIVATQRPSANVITGTIKTNIPTRISFKVASSVDSRIILDENGAEKLIGKGDMLLDENGKSHMKRIQGSFVSDEEIEMVTQFCKDQGIPNYEFLSEDLIKKGNNVVVDFEDDLFDDAVRFVMDLGEASASRIQRHFKVGYNRAARIIDMMEYYDIIAPHSGGSKPREVLMSLETYEDKF